MIAASEAGVTSMWAQSAAEVGKIIAVARRHHKLTQAELARALGATQTWVSEVEQGKETAQIGKILHALSYLGVRLRIGVAPWHVPKDTISEPGDISLDRLITAHAVPKRRETK
jgi:transcriptional regulator with XRE-family HTH domain